MVDLNKAPIDTQSGLIDCLSKIRDPRKARGIRHTQVSVLVVAICALLSVTKSFIGISDWAFGLSQELLKLLAADIAIDIKKYVPPSEHTLRRTLQSLDADKVDTLTTLDILETECLILLTSYLNLKCHCHSYRLDDSGILIYFSKKFPQLVGDGMKTACKN